MTTFRFPNRSDTLGIPAGAVNDTAAGAAPAASGPLLSAAAAPAPHSVEKAVRCFTPGTMIATPTGERAVEDLRVGDPVLTRDNGIQQIRWTGSKTLSARDLGLNPHLRPVLIRRGSLGNGLPERDFLVSPNHRIRIASDRNLLYFDENEVLVAARHLVSPGRIDQIDTQGVTYIHLLFDRHEVVLSNGVWTESFHLADEAFAGMGKAQQREIIDLFPGLGSRPRPGAVPAARRALDGDEVRRIGR